MVPCIYVYAWYYVLAKRNCFFFSFSCNFYFVVSKSVHLPTSGGQVSIGLQRKRPNGVTQVERTTINNIFFRYTLRHRNTVHWPLAYSYFPFIVASGVGVHGKMYEKIVINIILLDVLYKLFPAIYILSKPGIVKTYWTF